MKARSLRRRRLPPVRLGLVGVGAVAEQGYLPALAGVSQAEIVAVAEPLAGRRRLVLGASRFEDVDAMLAGERLDAAIVCSPPELHLEHALACARAGLPTLVEKPPGLTAAQADALARSRPEPLIGFNRRFARGLPVARRAVERATQIKAVFETVPDGWVADRPAPDPLLDLGCHLLDLCLWMTHARPLEVCALPAPRGRWHFEAELTDGLRLSVECGLGSAYRELIEMRDASGTVGTWRLPEPALAQRIGRALSRPPALTATWRAQLEAFVRVVRGEPEERLARAREAIPTMAALDAVRISAASGQAPVGVPNHPGGV